ncbi:hypothetical protein NQ103_09160 [Vibrio parahaemolyticus]|nr:hypothetical protein [Vibrio parahaemolyticus]
MRLGEGARAVGDGEGGGLGDGVSLVVDNDGGGSRAVGGVGSDDLGGPDNLAANGGGGVLVSGSKADEGSGGNEELHFESLVFFLCGFAWKRM